MALPSNLYVAFQGLETLFNDSVTATALSGGYALFFRDDNRTTPKNVYQQTRLPDNTYGFQSLGSRVPLNVAGAFSSTIDGTDIQVYGYPYFNDPINPSPGVIDLYYIRFYNADNIFQFDREAQPANVMQSGSSEVFIPTQNVILNPQFVNVNFNDPTNLSSPVTLSISGPGTTVTEIAPNWSLITIGTGTVTLTQNPIVTAPLDGNPPYTLIISSAGFSANIQLVQTIQASPRLLINGAIQGSILARSVSPSTAVDIEMDYIPSSNSATSFEIFSKTTTNSLATYKGTVSTQAFIPNPNPAPSGYMRVVLSFFNNVTVEISNIQLVGVDSVNATAEFIEESTLAQQSALFSYYQPQLNFKPIPSYLVGWDFPLNPAQLFGQTIAPSASNAAYTWDQTILYQSVLNSLATNRTTSGDMIITSSDATNLTQGAIIQYLSAPLINDILKNTLSINVRASSTVSAGLTATISIWYTTATNLAGTGVNLITTLDANGHPSVVAAGWTEIKRNNNLGNATFTIGSSFNDIAFNQWNTQFSSLAGTATFIAIVVGTSAIPNTQSVTFNSVSLQAGSIATIPASLSYSQTLYACSYYYESSYALGNLGQIAPGTPSQTQGSLITAQNFIRFPGNVLNMYATQFEIDCISPKRSITPSATLYSPITGASDKVAAIIYANGTPSTSADVGVIGALNWSILASSSKTISYVPSSNSGTAIYSFTPGVTATSVGAFIYYHYVVDARLGVIT